MDLTRRDESDVTALHVAPFDLITLVKDVLDGYRLRSARHELVLDASEESLVGSWDHDRIERTVDNLVSNAVKFSPEGGRISASVRSERTVGTAHTAVVAITDHGVGIPEGERDTIFDRFRRGSNVSDVPGSGVGLWSVRRIAEQHGGSLAVASRLGEGSTFTLRLPLAAADDQ